MLKKTKKNSTLLENETISKNRTNDPPPKTSKNWFKQGLSWICQLPDNLPLYLNEAVNTIEYYLSQPHHLTQEEQENYIRHYILPSYNTFALNPNSVVEEEKDSSNPRHFNNINMGIQYVRIFPRQGLRNLGNTCYANALFQCLFDVENFRNTIIHEMNQVQRPLTRQLGYFFKNLQERSIYTQDAYENLIEILFYKRKDFKIGVQGDSSVLFRALLEELADEGTYLKIFHGENLVKNKQCLQCKEKKQLIESLLILEPKNEVGTCKKCNKKRDFICTYEVMEFPEVLVIKIHDTINYNKKVKILPKITFKTASGKEAVKYEFIASVMNEERGKAGFHSVELGCYEGNYYIIDDDKKMEKVEGRLEDLRLHPKLLFYKKI